MGTADPTVNDNEVDIVPQHTNGAELHDEVYWEFYVRRAVVNPEDRIAEWKDKDGPNGFQKEAMGHMCTACVAAKHAAPATVTAAL